MKDELLAEAINDLRGGAAICFLGSGFTWGAKDAKGRDIPDVKTLRDEIRDLADLFGGDDASLTDLAEYCEENSGLSLKLQSHLVERLTLTQPNPEHKRIINQRWRAIFTTNYDDLPETSSNEIKTQIVTPIFEVKNLRTDLVPIYYLHGRALDVLDGAVDPKIVLSERNYLDLKNRNRDLYSALENEVLSASRVFFIGYSIRDAEIATRLFSIDGLREKSIVIGGPKEDPITNSRMKKFGEIYPLGTQGFAGLLPDDSFHKEIKTDIEFIKFVKYIKPIPPKEEIELSDVDRLLLSGEFDYSAYAFQCNDTTHDPEYCIPRKEKLNNLFERFKDINRYILTSDLGNGKSIFLNQVIYEAHVRGYEVFLITTQLPEALVELDILLNSTKRRIFIVDDYVRYRRVANHIGRRLPGTSVLITATRSNIEEIGFGQLADELGGAIREVDINALNDDEIKYWDKFLERWGFWEDKISYSNVDRFNFLKKECGGENRAIVLSMFETSRLSLKIETIVSYFLIKNPKFAKPFIAILINSLCQNHVDWSRIVRWMHIDEPQFKSAVMDSPVSDFMAGARHWYEFTSTQLANFILSRYEIQIEDVIEVYTKIVRETAYSANDPRSGFDSNENLKELMRYRYLTRLFSKKIDEKIAISSVYHRLSNVPRIRKNDQFWLQYAMARMDAGDLDEAEGYINTAIGLADKKGVNYSKRQIFDQRVRLRLQKYSKNDAKLNWTKISEAISDLTDALNDKRSNPIYPLRSAEYLLTFIERWSDELSTSELKDISELVELMVKSIGNGKLDKSQKGETDKIRRDIRDCSLVLANI